MVKNNGSATFRSQKVQALILYLLARGDSTPLHGTLMQFINVHGSSANFLLIWLRKGILSCYKVLVLSTELIFPCCENTEVDKVEINAG